MKKTPKRRRSRHRGRHADDERGMYTVTLHVWRRGESPANGGTAQCRLPFGGVDLVPVPTTGSGRRPEKNKGGGGGSCKAG